MTDAQEAGRTLARARWGGQVVSRALETLRERQAELSEAQRAELAVLAARRPKEREHD